MAVLSLSASRALGGMSGQRVTVAYLACGEERRACAPEVEVGVAGLWGGSNQEGVQWQAGVRSNRWFTSGSSHQLHSTQLHAQMLVGH